MRDISVDISIYAGIHFQDPLTFKVYTSVIPGIAVVIDESITTLNDVQLFFSGISGFDRGASILSKMNDVLMSDY